MNLISFKHHNKAFPLHYHPEYCISLIREGTELLNIDGISYNGTPGSITITHPYELHSNPLFSENNTLTFDTLYIDDTEFKMLSAQRLSTYFSNRVIVSKELQGLFNSAMDDTNTNALPQFVSRLAEFGSQDENTVFSKPLESWTQLEQFIDENIREPITLEEIARVANLNKFSFTRKFKQIAGISPIQYALMKKVFFCKDIMTPNSSFTDLAYEFNFTDVAHFSNCFKRFIGVSPSTYQQNFLR